MGDNVIKFPNRGGALESRILEHRRLVSSDKAKFAENLGGLAAKVNPSDPLAGAQRIIDASRLDGIWEKRKRYFRLPGEAAPASTKDGEYGSRPSTFVTLARAAARLMIRSDQPDRIEAEERRAIKKLAEGTSFASAFNPAEPQDQTAKSLLDEFAARLSAAVAERTRLVELWRVLEASPFFLETVGRYDSPDTEASPYGAAGEFPSVLLSSLFDEYSVVSARFTTDEASSADVAWANPRIKIGRVAIPVESRVFVVPKNIAAMLSPENDREERAASVEVAAWFETVAPDSRWLPEVDYSKSAGFGWKPCFLSLMCNVWLEISSGVDRGPAIQIATTTPWNEVIAYGLSDFELREPERIISEGGFRKSQAREVQIGRLENFKVVHALPFNEHADDEVAPSAVGIVERWIDGPFEEGFWADGWTEDAETSGLLMSNKARFYPAIPDATPANGPIVEGSIGAALLQNVMVASQETSIAAQLIARAQLIADAALRFHDAMIEHYRESIRRI